MRDNKERKSKGKEKNKHANNSTVPVSDDNFVS